MAAPCNRLTRKLYLIGDSNTEKASLNNGFAAKLTEEYTRRLDVINRGFSGYTTEDIRVMIPKLLKNDNSNRCIHTATILLSTNDSVDPELDKRAVDVNKSKENLEFIIKSLRNDGISNIILLTPPPIDGEKWHNLMMETYKQPGSFSNSRVVKYVEMCKQLAKEQQIHIVDLYDCIIQLENWEQYFYDGLHFSQSGNMLVFYKLKEVLDLLFADLLPPYPDWKDIDRCNLEVSLG